MLWSEKLALQFQKKERKKLALRHLNVEARHALGRPCHDGICGLAFAVFVILLLNRELVWVPIHWSSVLWRESRHCSFLRVVTG